MQNISANAQAGSSPRIQYIDALRGLSMILVVLAHVFLFMSPGLWDGSPIAAILMSFRMPLFFFVSGFFAYKAVERWTSSVIADIMKRKARAQILCATIFFMIYQYVNHAPLFAFVEEGYGFFWFTIALFQMFTVYVALNVVSRAVRHNIVDPALIVLSVASMFYGLTPVNDQLGVALSWHQIIVYFQYFATGVLVHRHHTKFINLLNSDILRTIVIALFVLGCIVFYGEWYHQPKVLGDYLLQGVLHRYTGLFSVLVFFHERSSYFNGNAAVARFLKFTGRRTLDIYMMHIFFIPHLASLSWVRALAPANMAVLKLAFGLAIALAVTGLCLLCSNLLRSSKFLEVWLFGVRPLKKETVQE